MPTPEDAIGDDLAALFDHLAKVTLAPDDDLAELRAAIRRRAAPCPGDGPQRCPRLRGAPLADARVMPGAQALTAGQPWV